MALATICALTLQCRRALSSSRRELVKRARICLCVGAWRLPQNSPSILDVKNNLAGRGIRRKWRLPLDFLCGRIPEVHLALVTHDAPIPSQDQVPYSFRGGLAWHASQSADAQGFSFGEMKRCRRRRRRRQQRRRRRRKRRWRRRRRRRRWWRCWCWTGFGSRGVHFLLRGHSLDAQLPEFCRSTELQLVLAVHTLAAITVCCYRVLPSFAHALLCRTIPVCIHHVFPAVSRPLLRCTTAGNILCIYPPLRFDAGKREATSSACVPSLADAPVLTHVHKDNIWLGGLRRGFEDRQRVEQRLVKARQSEPGPEERHGTRLRERGQACPTLFALHPSGRKSGN